MLLTEVKKSIKHQEERDTGINCSEQIATSLPIDRCRCLLSTFLPLTGSTVSVPTGIDRMDSDCWRVIMIQQLSEHSHAPEQVAGPPWSLPQPKQTLQELLTKPCTSDTSTLPTCCEDANLTAEGSVTTELCRMYTPLSTKNCRNATANHKTDMTTQRSDAAYIDTNGASAAWPDSPSEYHQ